MQLASKLVKGVVYLAGGNILMKLFSFFTVILITRELSLYGFGALTLALALGGPIAALSELGISELLVSDIANARGKNEKALIKRLLIDFARTKILITISILILALFFKSFLVDKYGVMIEDYFMWLSVWVIIQAISVIFQVIFSSHERFKYQSISNVIEVFSKFVYVIIAWQLFSLTPITVLTIYTLSKLTSVVISIPFIVKTLNYLKNTVSSKKNVLLDILRRHGKWEIIKGTFTKNIESGARPWIIKFIIGVESVAVLEVASMVYGAALSVLPIKSVIFPIISRNINDLRVAQLVSQKATKYSFLFFSAVIFGAIIFADPFIRYVFPKYLDSIFLFRILIFRLLPVAVGMGQPAFFYAFKAQKESFYFTLINLIALFTTLPLFTYSFGIIGPYIEKFFTLSLGIYVKEKYLRKKKKVATWKWKNLFVFDKYDKYILKMFIYRFKLVLHRK